MWAADVWAFVPVDANPAHRRHQIVGGTGHETFLVGVFDAEDEFTAVMTGKQPVE